LPVSDQLPSLYASPCRRRAIAFEMAGDRILLHVTA
jgi:hypothetical protein